MRARKLARGAPRMAFQKAVGVGTLLLPVIGSLIDFGLDKGLDAAKEKTNEKHRADRLTADAKLGYITPESQRKAAKHSIKDMKAVLQTMDENMVKFKDAFDAVYQSWPDVANIGEELFEVSPDGTKATEALFTFIGQLAYAEHYREKLEYHLAGVVQFAKDFEAYCNTSEAALKASRSTLEECIDKIVYDREFDAEFNAGWNASANGPVVASNFPKANGASKPVAAANFGFQGGVVKK